MTNCDILAELEAAYRQIITGGGVKTVRIVTGDAIQETQFHKGNEAALRAEIAKYSELCDKESGRARRRYAIRGG